MNEEQKYLKFVLDYINRELNFQLDSFEQLQHNYRREPDKYITAYYLACELIKIYKNGINNPYFARIDFKEEEKEETKKIYIGKYGITDEKERNIVVDWRAPISSLYYDSELGKVSYECPEGIIHGDLKLKRQIKIEQGNLKNFFDVDIVSSDELLQKYLNENNNVRLKNIVSTIQKEQNKAIRKPLNKNIIIQGVAGSGKTTIALHRIAYLVYNYRRKLKNNQYLIIGPNDVFLKYIESVLPDLDVNDVVQKTYIEFAIDVIKEQNIKVNDQLKYLNKYLTKKVANDIPKFKSSLDYMTMIDMFMDEYINDICEKDLMIKDYKVLDVTKIKSIFEVAMEGAPNLEFAIERFVFLSSNYVDRNKERIISDFNKNYRCDKNNPESLKNKTYIREVIDKNCKTVLRNYVSSSKLSVTKLYKKFINNIEKYDGCNYQYLNELKNITLENIKNKCYDFEDLAPLMYIRYRLGIGKYEKKIKQVVIDEAQDFGEFNFYALKKCLPDANFSIYGDIAQSIYDYRSIDSWEQVSKIIEDCEIINFNKSYRTTDQIMTVANAVVKTIDILPSELSVRQGEAVAFTKEENDNIPALIKKKVEYYKEQGYNTIAIVSKYPLQSSYLNDDLSFEGLYITNIENNDDITQDKNKIVTISNALAKGLEFDVVILNNANENIYDSTNSSDMKMLYVALTRALHKLDIIYSDEITKPLDQFVRNKTLVKK